MELDDYNGNGYYDIKDFIEAPNEKILEFNKDMKFDVILANPPYDNGLHEKFSIKYFDICDCEICWVSPLSFLLGKRQNKKLTVHLDKYRTDIEQINGNEFFDAAIGGTMGIVYVDMSDKYLHYVKFDGKEYERCSEISNLDSIFESFKNKVKCDKLTDSLQNHLKAQPNKNYLQNIIETNPNDNWWCVGIVSMHAPLKSDGSHGDSWYAMISKNKLNEYHCQYKDLKRKLRTDKNGNTSPLIVYYFPFNSKEESDNFLTYIQTYFVQSCLHLIKFGSHFDRGELKYVPWQDFTEFWDDEKLFKKYGITKEEIQHIYDILPNYYGIERINLDEYEL